MRILTNEDPGRFCPGCPSAHEDDSGRRMGTLPLKSTLETLTQCWRRVWLKQELLGSGRNTGISPRCWTRLWE